FFNRAIVIVNPFTYGKDTVAKIPVANTSISKADVQFFPEGGYLVNGIATKVAFKAVATNGMGTAVTGTITNDKGQVISHFNTEHLGMGVFNITPKAGETYRANVTYGNGTVNTIALPKALDKGYVLSIADNDGQNLTVKVIASKPLVNDDPNRQLTL